MNRTRALPTVLEVLDDGLRLYRRNLSGFMLVATAVLVLIALFALLCSALIRTQLGTSAAWTVLLLFLLTVIGYPLLLYAFAALSRAAAAALDGRPISLPVALRISPGRGCAMILFNLVFSVVASIFAGTISIMISCPLFYFSVLSAAMVSTIGSGAVSGAAIAFASVISQVSTLWSLMAFGGWLVSIVYALQAFVLEQRSWSAAAGRSVDLLTARFGRSMLMFLSAGAIFGTLSLAYLGSLIALILIVQERFGLTLPPLASDVLTIVLTVASLVVLLPPLSIWMTMFHRHLAREQDGEEMARRVAAWHAQVAA
ncbi:MAG TPA: hypothetical protein VFZ66_28265 [Herpetosiphonaceae bacterium]